MLTAVLLATKILFTGVIPLIPSAKDPHLVRVVVPNGMESGIPKMPSHVAYLMFDMKQLDPSGRKPNFIIMDHSDESRAFGVCLIEGEFLEASGTFEQEPQPPLCQPTISAFQLTPCANATGSTSAAFPAVQNASLSVSDESLHWLFDFGQENVELAKRIDTTLLNKQPDATHVILRMDLRVGKLATAPNTFDLRYAYRLADNGKCQALSKGIGVTLQNPQGTAATLIINSTPFGHATASKPPLILTRAVDDDDDVVVLVGNEPVDAIEESIDLLVSRVRSCHHEDTANHLQLMRQLLINGGDLNIPAEIPAGACQNGMSPSINGSTGGSGACNPGGMPAVDPASNGG